MARTTSGLTGLAPNTVSVPEALIRRVRPSSSIMSPEATPTLFAGHHKSVYPPFGTSSRWNSSDRSSGHRGNSRRRNRQRACRGGARPDAAISVDKAGTCWRRPAPSAGGAEGLRPERQRRLYARFLAASRAQIAPHGKTTMSPQLFGRQLDDGAVAITIATVQQMQVARHYGFDRMMMANQPGGRRRIRYCSTRPIAIRPSSSMLRRFPGAGETAGRGRAPAPSRRQARSSSLSKEGFHGGRTGCRSCRGADVANAVQRARPSPALRASAAMRGCSPAPTPGDRKAGRRLSRLSLTKSPAHASRRSFGSGTVMLTAGGSSFYDRVAARFNKAQVRRPVRC